jgi:hypothetical protein
MTKVQIFQLFQKPYNQAHWKQFLGETFTNARLLAAPETLAGIDKNVAGKALMLGHIVLNENGIERHIAVYEVQLLPGIVLERNRVGLRNLLRKYWKNIDAAFIVYHNPENKNWRFSYVSELTGFDADGNFQKIQTEPKRFTYVLGEGESVRTAAERFALLAQKAGKATLDDVKEAFSVEKVTKEFYTEIAQWYDWALQHVKFPKDAEAQENGRNIAVIRLLTRLFFIWFMKEKGLIPAELFDEHQLRNILKNFNPADTSNGNYYKAILQNLFFATLNTPIEQRKFRRETSHHGKNPDYMNHQYYRYHALFANPDENLKLFKDIPFLNGGLFECLDLPKDGPNNPTGREIRIDGYSDVPEKQPFVSNHLFFDADKGILSIFNKYHFTIEENTPFDQQVSLDPEMLGKVFENLLATYNPETRETARKATGSFYTPREIVYFMVKTSLKEYFKTKLQKDIPEQLDERLEQLFSYADTSNPFNKEETERLIEAIHQVKILDPAVGSGAFPMETLNQMVHLLSKLDPNNELWKTQQIQAIQNAVADPRLKQKTIEHIENIFSHNELGYGRKLFLIQNCLYGVDIQPIAIHIAKLRFFLSLLVDEKINDQLPNKGIEPLPNLETKLIAANTLIALPKRNGGLQLPQIEELEQQLFQLRQRYFEVSDQKEKEKIKNEDRRLRLQIQQQMKNGGFPSEFADAIAAADIYDTQASHPWFDPEWMLGVKDGFDVVIGNPPYIDSETMVNVGMENLRKYLVSNLKFTRGNWDIYIAFFEVGFYLLNNRGILAFITPDKWISKPFGYELRKNLLKNIFIITEAGRNIFESVNVDSIVTFISKRKRTNIAICRFKQKHLDIMISISNKSITDPFTFDWLFSDNIQIITKIESQKYYFDRIAQCENACATSDAYKLKEYIFDLVSADKFNKNQHLKVINTGSIDKYTNKWGRTEMTYLGDKYLFPVVLKDKFCKYFQNTYGVKSLKPKLIMKGLTLLDVCIDEIGSIVPGKSTLLVISDNALNLKFALGFLNSKIPFFYIKEKYKGSSYNQGINFNKHMINKLPLPEINDKVFNKIVILVDQILAAKKANPQADTSHLEREIDQLVYQLYELTEEEIEIIENSK